MATENGQKVLFFARVISVQSIAMKWYFCAFFFNEMPSLFWFSLFLLPLSGFWPFSFKPPRAVLGWSKIMLKYTTLNTELKQN